MDDDTVIRALYDKYRRPLFGYVLRSVGDRQYAEDIVQETMTRAWTHAADLDPDRFAQLLYLILIGAEQVLPPIAKDDLRDIYALTLRLASID